MLIFALNSELADKNLCYIVLAVRSTGMICVSWAVVGNKGRPLSR